MSTSARVFGKATVIAAACAVVIAGCGTAQQSTNPRQAISLAAQTSRHITSLTATETMTMTRAGSAAARFGMSIHLAMRLKPTLLASADATATAAGHTFSIREILTRHAIYMNMGSLGAFLHRPTAKPWIKINLAQIASRFGLARLFRKLGQVQLTSNPLAQARLFAAATHLRRVGTGVVDGVPATEYSGVLTPSALVKFLPATQRAALGAVDRVLGHSAVPFQVWIDGQNYIRQLTMRLSAMGVAIRVKLIITSVNKPVMITPPPASQVSTMRIPRF